MCGIVGYIGTREAPEICLAGLRRIEYRGYDSAGIAVVNGKNLDQRKVVGKLDNMAEALAGNGISGTVGIGHTRWATHGRPSLENSHPHFSADVRIAVVHNGILENYQELRAALKADGIEFKSQTDTETMARAAASHLGIKQARGRAQSIELLLKVGIGMAQFVHQRRSETDEGANLKRHPLALTD